MYVRRIYIQLCKADIKKKNTIDIPDGFLYDIGYIIQLLS